MNEPPKGVYLPAVITYLADLPSGVVMFVYYDPLTWEYYLYSLHEAKIELPRDYFIVSSGDFRSFFKALNKIISEGCHALS